MSSFSRKTALNGYYERLRRLMRMLGADPLPPDFASVVIAADSREPGAGSGAYRRFTVTRTLAAAVAADTTYIFVPRIDVVLTKVTVGWQGTATSNFSLRWLSPAQVTATGLTLAQADGAWIDAPDGGLTPWDVHLAPVFAGAGSLGHWLGVVPGLHSLDLEAYLPAGAGVTWRLPATGTTYNHITFSGYAR